MVAYAYERGVQLRLIQRYKPIPSNRNVCIESFNSRKSDECLNKHQVRRLLHERTVIETWHRG